MGKEQKDWPTTVLYVGTAVAAITAAWLLWGAGLFRRGGDYLSLGALEHVGSFIGGVFTPIAVGWAARSFHLQRQQMVDSMEKLQRQNELARLALEQSMEQSKLARERDIVQTDPLLQITKESKTSMMTGISYQLRVLNHGATAQRMRISYKFTDVANNLELASGKLRVAKPVVSGQHQDFGLSFPYTAIPIDFKGRVVVLAERLDGLVSEFIFETELDMGFELVSARRADPSLSLSDP